jgi:hypothetical protein
VLAFGRAGYTDEVGTAVLDDSRMTRRDLILFVLLGVAWGIPYLLIKIAVGELSPAMLVFARTALAAVVLLPVAAVRGELRPVLARWLGRAAAAQLHHGPADRGRPTGRGRGRRSCSAAPSSSPRPTGSASALA